MEGAWGSAPSCPGDGPLRDPSQRGAREGAGGVPSPAPLLHLSPLYLAPNMPSSPLTFPSTCPLTCSSICPLTSPLTCPLTYSLTSPLYLSLSPLTSPLTCPFTLPFTSPLTFPFPCPLPSPLTFPLFPLQLRRP